MRGTNCVAGNLTLVFQENLVMLNWQFIPLGYCIFEIANIFFLYLEIFIDIHSYDIVVASTKALFGIEIGQL